VERQYRHSVFFPLLLITIGVIYLLNVLGYILGDPWVLFLKLWPLLFIIGGLDNLFTGRGYIWAVISLGLVGWKARLLMFPPSGPTEVQFVAAVPVRMGCSHWLAARTASAAASRQKPKKASRFFMGVPPGGHSGFGESPFDAPRISP